MAADSGATIDSESGGSRKTHCRKLYRKWVGLQDGTIEDCLIGLAGDSTAGLILLDALFSAAPDEIAEARNLLQSSDAHGLLLTRNGLFEIDGWFRPDPVVDLFWAIGSGAKAALGAMYAGMNAVRAVEIAKLIDPYTFGPIVSASLLSASGIIPKDASPGKIIEITTETT